MPGPNAEFDRLEPRVDYDDLNGGRGAQQPTLLEPAMGFDEERLPTSRRLPPRSSPLLAGQDILTVPDMDAKLAAQQAGLGVGFLPRWLALPAAEAGALQLCQVEHPNPPAPVYYAWRERRPGRALAWFLAQLALPDVCARLLGGAP